jgi:hypothetical protein
MAPTLTQRKARPHVRLIPANHARAVRNTGPGSQAPPGLRGLIEAPIELVSAGGRARCRCCGRVLEFGTPALRFRYDFETSLGMPSVYIHLQACRWGVAHREEICPARNPLSLGESPSAAPRIAENAAAIADPDFDRWDEIGRRSSYDDEHAAEIQAVTGEPPWRDWSLH